MEESDNKEKILEGTEALFMKYGIRSVSMDDIARHLSVSKKTLYQYFADKDELVYRMSERYLARMSKNYEQIREEAKNSVEELSLISLRIKKDFENMNTSMLFDLQKFHPRAWGLYIRHKESTICQSVVRNIEHGIQDGYYRADLNPEIMAIIRVMMIEDAFDEQAFPRQRFSFVDVQHQVFELFVQGICTEKGRKLYQKYKQSNNPQLTTSVNETVL
jgi:TetR/AcrR family transcriptional regulator, cholesterol catabolism regulator